jgi:protein phosphatase
MERKKMKAAVFTSKGNRERNEDAALAGDLFQEEMEELKILETKIPVFAVSDGIGSCPDGRLASRIVIEEIKRERGWKKGIEKARKRLKEIEENRSIRGLGATVAGIQVKDKQIEIFNCGDSRVYKINGPFLLQLTPDHRIEGTNVITCAVTSEESPVFSREITKKRSTFLICTDGVWSELSEDQLEECLDPDPETFGKKLLNALKKKKPSDNYTFVIVEVER